jgi:F-type H+-transporting ATPase subunit a
LVTFRIILIGLALLLGAPSGFASSSGSRGESTDQEQEGFNTSEFILGHIADSHEWHILTTPSGHHVSLYLPVIIYSRNSGFHLFSSKKIAHGHHHGDFYIAEEGPLEGRIIESGHTDIDGVEYMPLDFSITKNVAAMFIAASVGLLLFLSLARSYRKGEVTEPRGIQAFLEPLILFVRDDIVIPNIGEHKYEKYLPYMLTIFFFILINNLLGMIPIFPFGANVTGNIAVTLVLAVLTFIITQFSGNRNYWRHIFATPGVPFWLLPIMIVVELIGAISKPFALMVRLFANITAGHIIILSLLSLIFIFKSLWVVPASAAFVIFMDFLELLVAFLQAYVFTLLSSLFVGLAVEEHH